MLKREIPGVLARRIELAFWGDGEAVLGQIQFRPPNIVKVVGRRGAVMPVEHSLTADLVVAVVALIALVVSLLTFLDSYRYRRTVTEAQLAVKWSPWC